MKARAFIGLIKYVSADIVLFPKLVRNADDLFQP